MTFLEAIATGLRFKRLGEPHFYQVRSILLSGEGSVERFMSTDELSVTDWEVEEKSFTITQSELTGAVNKAVETLGLKVDQIKAIQDAVSSELST
jgi:hypothetical protein